MATNEDKAKTAREAAIKQFMDVTGELQKWVERYGSEEMKNLYWQLIHRGAYDVHILGDDIVNK